MKTRNDRTAARAVAVLLAVPALVGASAGLRPRVFDPQDLRDAIDRQIHRSPAELVDLPGYPLPPPRFNPKLSRLYHDRDMRPYWVTAGGPNLSAEILRSVLGAADTQGLNPADYAIDQIARAWDRKGVEGLARLELLLTLELGAYASDLVEGRLKPRDFDPELFPTACDCDLDPADLVEKCLAAPDLRVFLEAQAPPFPQYRGLRDKLAAYRGLAARGGWPQVPPGPSLKPGMTDPRVAALRRRLSVTGECPADGPMDRPEYDEALAAAVNRFQRHHGLDSDGVLGEATLAALNVPVERRIAQLIVNMESWRWVARDHGDRWLEVNIPSFELTALRGDKAELRMSVIVGDEYHMTPVFSDRLRYVEFNPYWNVPLSISRKEMLPKLQKDPSYLKKERIRMFEGWNDDTNEVDSAAVHWSQVGPEDMGRWRLRQDSGPDNSLGTVAFIFPNAFDVYLHDTPAQGLFGLPKRTFSHGCIRVSSARELAAYVLGGPDKGWTEERIRNLIADGKNQVIHLDPSLPIYILYNTAVVDPESRELYFYRDVYGRDALLEKALFQQ
jgi:murein L,D-transpeptidase YcbB/YkuD